MTLAERIKGNLNSLTTEDKQIIDDAVAFDIERRGVSYIAYFNHVEGVEYDDMSGAVVNPNYVEKVMQYLQNQGMTAYRGKDRVNRNAIVVTL